jgi:SAM-dependent methyltransferase
MESNSRAVWDSIFAKPDKVKKAGGRYFYSLALPRIRTGETVCDAGCGYTFYLQELMKRCGPNGAFVGIDFSSAALASSAESVKGFSNAQLLLADLRQLPLPDGCMDRTLCSETLPYLLEDVEIVLKELARVSKQEVVFSLHARGTYEIKGTGNEFRGDMVIEHKPGAKPPRRIFDRDAILDLVKSVGHLRVEIVKPFRWMDLMDTRSTGGEWPWYLPSPETIALYYVVAKKTQETAISA